MKKALAILAVLSLAAFAGQIAVNLNPIPRTDADWLVYDDGTPAWYTWGGTYRGVWFNTDDFQAGGSAASITQAELWFYHSDTRPWDTSDVYVELWNGDQMAPVTQLDQSMAVALDYAPIYVNYSPAIVAETNFWCLANTEMSAGGWPSMLGDGMASGAFHSFFSSDFIVWEPWDINGACNYFIAVYGDIEMSLDNTTWGSLKATF